MKKYKFLFTVIFILNEIIRFSSVFLIFYNPILAWAVYFLFDYLDAPLAFFCKVLPRKDFYILDKVLDYWFYIFILIYSYQLPIFPIVFLLFIYRTVGQILTIQLYKEIYLFIFPNLFEFYFVFYLLFKEVNLKLFILLVIISLAREFEIHIRPINLNGIKIWKEYRIWKEK